MMGPVRESVYQEDASSNEKRIFIISQSARSKQNVDENLNQDVSLCANNLIRAVRGTSCTPLAAISNQSGRESHKTVIFAKILPEHHSKGFRRGRSYEKVSRDRRQR